MYILYTKNTYKPVNSVIVFSPKAMQLRGLDSLYVYVYTQNGMYSIAPT